MVIVDHPLGGISDDDLRQRIDAAYDQTVELLAEADDAVVDVAAANVEDVDVDADVALPTDTAVAENEAQTPDEAPFRGRISPHAGVDAALDELRQALANDGAGLRVRKADDAGITVELTFTDETCMDCVIPPHILQPIITDTLESNGFEQKVSVVDPRGD